ncbi:MAG: GNAT family N-acetyltransferase [Spirochaetaceae bacterium]|jgi:phosphinothricin acetyltransferase|nr:GNAT family N-acetyltransferase [Spirochaetaceae bacterium]
MIRPVTTNDAAALCGIYNYYIANTVITFEEEELEPAAMEARIRDITGKYPWFVWEEDGELLGYAYAHKWNERAAYRFSAEDSVYLRHDVLGRRLGRQLLGQVIAELRKTNIRVLMSVITMPNERSVALHEGFGFQKAAEFREIGYKLNRWLNVGYWELLL